MAKEVNFVRPFEEFNTSTSTSKVKYVSYQGGSKGLSTSAELDEVKGALEKVLDSLKSADFANGIPTLPWADNKYAVTLTLTHATADNTDARTSGKYVCNLAAENTYTLTTVSVTMGGTDITATAYANGKVTIAEVTGAIVIVATGTK